MDDVFETVDALLSRAKRGHVAYTEIPLRRRYLWLLLGSLACVLYLTRRRP